MKKIVFYIAFFIIVFFVFLKFIPQEKIDSQKIASQQFIPIPTKVAIEIPQKLSIPSQNITSEVEQVFLDNENRMDVPKIKGNVGWYAYGPKPGEIGSAVIDGHVDNPDGSPSVFYNLSKLQKGEKIIIYDSKNKSYTFTITKVEQYSLATIPLGEIFNSSRKVAQLNLITCAGSWDKSKRQYSDRLVVFSELEQ